MRTTTLAVLAAAFLFSTPPGASAEAGRSADAVVELFTSQGCYSCPPADALLREVIDRRPQVVALEYHVDYWDDLVYGSAGSWRDPFSDPAFTARQRDYHGNGVGGRRGVYTPQMIVNGSRALVGSHRGTLQRELADAPRLPLDVLVEKSPSGYTVRFAGRYEGSAQIWQVDYIDSARTPVAGGENNGKFLSNHNIVTGMRHIGRWWGKSPEFTLRPPSGAATGCAVLVQEDSGRIVGAAYCPT